MRKLLSLLLPALLLASCAGGNADKDKAKNEYTRALNDSVEAIQRDIDSCQNQLQVMSDNVNEWMRDFTAVNNSREVEGYYIFNGWQDRYPLQATGMIARISNNETLELIAALKGATFNSVSVVCGEDTASSAVVPYDQALNYRRDGINTVMFSGEEADNVARLIADNQLNNVKVVFTENGKTKSSWQMPDDYKKMISATWMLYSSRRQQMQLENRITLDNHKIAIIKTHLGE